MTAGFLMKMNYDGSLMANLHHHLLRILPEDAVLWAVKRAQFQRFRWWLEGNKSPVLVYQMGKVGSQSVAASLAEVFPEAAVFHFHYLDPETLAFTRRKARCSGRAYPGDDYWISLFVRELLLKGTRRGPLKVITLTRDPVARNLSGFFQSLNYWAPDLYASLESVADIKDLYPSLRERFLEEYHHDWALDWFENELGCQLGLDIFQDAFPVDMGYQIIREEIFELLIIRLEDLTNVFQKAISVFFNREDIEFELQSRNLAREKTYSGMYRGFLDQLILPEEYLRQMYDSPYASHFYSLDERELFFNHWSGEAFKKKTEK